MSRAGFLSLATIAFVANAFAGNYVVVYKSQQVPPGAASRIAANGGTIVRTFNDVGVAIVNGNDAIAANVAKDASVQAVGPEHMFGLPAINAVEVAEPDGLGTSPTSADTLYYYQWDVRRIGAPAVWARYPLATKATPTVAVLDVGVADSHPDLLGQVFVSKATSYCQTPGGPSNTDGFPSYATLIDFDAHPTWNPSDGCTATTLRHEWHGTHVAGTIAAKFGGGRVVGVAPDAQIAAYKVFDRYRYTDSKNVVHDAVGAFDGPIFAAIIDAAQKGYSVINMSLGSADFRNDKNGNASWLAWDRVTKYANRLGILIVASAGNDAINANGAIYHMPSDLPTVVSVSATDASSIVLANGLYDVAPGTDTLATYSDYGSAVDIAAPGGDCATEQTCSIVYYIVNAGVTATGASTYYGAAGTSMACPHVAAVAAEVRALHPDWTPGDVRSFLKETSDPIGPRQWFGAGLVNADTATK